VYDSLASVYDHQVFVATYSQGFVRRASPEEILCFACAEDETTDIVRGDRHPILAGWDGWKDPTLLFATGVFG